MLVTLDEMLFSKIVTTALHCCHAGMVIYMRDTKRDTHIETESGVREVALGVPQKPAEQTFPLTFYQLPTLPSSHFPTHTPSISHSLSSPPPHRHLQLRAEEMLKCQSDSENFLEKKLSLPSTPQQALLPPPSPPLEA